MRLRIHTRAARPIGAAVLAAAALLAVQRQAHSDAQRRVEFEGRQWVADADSNLAVRKFRGRPALNVRGGVHTYAYLADVDFRDGTIEVDMAAGPRGVPGVAFRGSQDAKHVDRVAFRSSAPDSLPAETAVEQAVITRRDGTFVFLRMSSGIEVTKWFHVKVVVLGEKMEVYLNDAEEPVFIVDKILDGETRGTVGVWGLQDVYFANFQYTSADQGSGGAVSRRRDAVGSQPGGSSQVSGAARE
jgi:hypothetical protein